MDPELKRWRRRVLFSTWLCYAGFYFCRKPFYVVKASLGEELGWDASTLGAIGAAYLASYTVGQFIAGLAGQRWGPRIVLLLGLMVSGVCNIVFGFTNSYATFLTFMVVNGLAQATGWSNTVGTMATWFHRQERGAIMGLWSTNYTVGSVLSKALAAYILGAIGFRYSFFGGTLVITLVWIVVLLFQRNKPEDVGLAPVQDPDDDDDDDRQPESDSGGWSRQVVITILLMGCFYFFVKFVRYALWSWSPYFLKLNFGLEADEAGYLSIVFDIAGIAGAMFSGWASDRFFKARRAKIAFLMLVGMMLSCLFMYALGGTATWIFATSMGLTGFMLYGPDALMTGAGAIDVGSKRSATLAAAIINGMGSFGSIVQDLVIGDLYDKSGGDLGPIFALLFASAGGAAFFMAVILWRNHRGMSDL